MRKFSLFSRASLASMLAAEGNTLIVAAAETPGEAENEGGETPTPSPAPAPTPAPKPPETPTPAEGEEGEEGSGTDATAQVVTVADAKAVSLDAAASARKAEGARWSTVFASAEALADPGLAAFMLTHSPDASAEAVITQLKTRAPGSSAAAAAPAATIPDTNLDLGRGDAHAAIGDGQSAQAEAGDAWDASSKRVFGNVGPGMKVGAGDAGPNYGSITSGGSLSHTPAAQRPTGN